MNDMLCRQLAADYCFSTDEIIDSKNHFSVFYELDGRRRYRGDSDCYLKIAVVNGKVLFNGKEKILHWCMEQYRNILGESML